MAVTLWLASTSVAQQGFFKGLGDLLGDPPFEAYAWAVSADGSTVVGVGTTAIEGNINYREAFRWTAETGMVGLGDLPGGYVYSEAYAVSADGSVVVGTSSSTNGLEAFRWTAETGMVGLGDLPDDPFESYAYGVSADGSIVVGAATTSGSLEEPVREAFRWTVLTGMNNSIVQRGGIVQP